MKGTALLMDEDHTVKIFEDIGHDAYEELISQKRAKNKYCTIDDKKIELGPITKIVWYEDTIDWNYGY